jgi:hypothetical protein
MNRGRTCGRGPRPAGCREWLGWELPDHLGGSHRSAPVPYCAVTIGV